MVMENRTAFVTHEYRTVEESNPAIRAKFGNAKVISLDSNLSLGGASVRALEILADGASTRAFEVTVQQIFLPDDFKDGPPRVAIYSPLDGLDGDEFKTFDCQTSLKFGTTVLKVR